MSPVAMAAAPLLPLMLPLLTRDTDWLTDCVASSTCIINERVRHFTETRIKNASKCFGCSRRGLCEVMIASVDGLKPFLATSLFGK